MALAPAQSVTANNSLSSSNSHGDSKATSPRHPRRQNPNKQVGRTAKKRGDCVRGVGEGGGRECRDGTGTCVAGSGCCSRGGGAGDKGVGVAPVRRLCWRHGELQLS